LINDSGTLTAADGRIQQFSNTTQQSLDSSYEFQGDTLVTHNQLGTAEWHRVSGSSTASNSPSSTKHKSSGDSSTRRSNSGNGEVGRQILNRFMGGHGFP
jgi:hypothetical protein